jgi:hypothetical protein
MVWFFFFKNYTSSAAGTSGRGVTVAPATVVGQGGRGLVRFKKIVSFCLNSDVGKLYMKTVALDEIYNFVV